MNKISSNKTEISNRRKTERSTNFVKLNNAFNQLSEEETLRETDRYVEKNANENTM